MALTHILRKLGHSENVTKWEGDFPEMKMKYFFGMESQMVRGGTSIQC